VTSPDGGTQHSEAAPSLLTPGFLALFAAALVFFTAGSIVLPVAARFAAGPLDADATGVGISIGAFAIAALALRPVVGWASDRFGRRPLLIVGCALTVVALGLHLVADTLPMFVVARSVLGIAEAFFLVAALAAISDLAPPERRGEAINLGSLSVYLGLAFGPFLGDTILSIAGFDVVWLVAAALAAIALGLSLVVPETAPAVLRASEGEPRPRSRLIHPAGLFPGFLLLTGAWGMAGFLAFLPLHATEVGLANSGVPLALYALIVVGLRIVFAKLPDQIGAARLSGTALTLAAIGLVLVGILPGVVGLLLGTVVVAVGIAFMFPGLIALAVSRVDETERGSVVGTTTVFLDLSFGLAPAVLGVVVEATGYGIAFVSAGLVSAFGAAMLFARRHAVARPAVA
jgi:MFS family permease